MHYVMLWDTSTFNLVRNVKKEKFGVKFFHFKISL